MELTVGAILEGKVKSITNFGAFIALPENKTGLVHISEVADSYVNDVNEFLKVKDTVKGIFILSPYIIEPLKEDMMRARMDEYVEICRRLSDKHGCKFVDFQKMYADYCKIRHSSYIAWDRIHPNQVGATLMAREFLKKCVSVIR